MAKIKRKSDNKEARSFAIWMTVIGVLLVASYAAFLGLRSRPPKHFTPPYPPLGKGGQGGVTEAAAVEDPVCGMMVKPPASGHVEYRAKHYYFCSISCKEDFEMEPEKYVHSKEKKEMK